MDSYMIRISFDGYYYTFLINEALISQNDHLLNCKEA